MRHLGDICKISGYDVPIVDVVTGGSPCQDLSISGNREGLDGKRSGLFMEQIRIIKEMRERDRSTGRTGWLVRPRYMVWENVDGARSSPGKDRPGADFAKVIEEIIKVCEPQARVCVCVPEGGWTKSGCYYAADGTWSIAWRVHDAQFWGVPQRRKRIALVADFGGLSAPEILFERKGLSRDFEQSGTAQKRATKGTESGADSSICLQGNGIDRSDTAGCNGAGWRRGGATPLNTVDRPAVLSFQERAGKPGGAKESYCRMSEQEHCQPSTTNPSLTAGFDGSAGSSAGSIGFEEEKAITTKTSGGGHCIIRRGLP